MRQELSKHLPDEMDPKGRLLHAVNGAAALLLAADEAGFEDSLREAMALLARCMEVDRIYIWRNQMMSGCLRYIQQFEWLGAADPQGETVPSHTIFSYQESIPEWEEKLLKGECINGPLGSLSSAERKRLTPYGIRSILVIPVHLQNHFWGFVSFDDCHKERAFTGDEVSILRSASLMLASAKNRHEMTHDIQVAVEQAQAASKAKSAFLAHVSHEIRTPMNVIAGMAELMLREDIPAAIYEHVLSVKHASSNLLSLINGILDSSKIEAGSLEIVSSEYSLTSLINDVLIVIRMKVSEKPVLFTANIDCNIPNRLIGDETRVRQILLNVLDNAAKYTNEGFISLTINGEVTEDTVVLTAEVSDSGVGIKPENMDTLFDDFIRFDSERNKSIQGTGLGLSITKSLCRVMGGHISAHSEYGVGSTFVITVPQKIKSYDEKFAHVSEPETKRVLLYETRSLYADSIVRSLVNLGVRCTWVQNQTDFYNELTRQAYPFVFVMMSESAGRMAEELAPDATLVLLTEFGETPRNVRTIATPAHAASLANILDDSEDNCLYNVNEHIRFTAPSAEILVVDDLKTNLQVAQGLMRPYQMQIELCGSGAEAIACVRKKRYDLIFMDHMMPDMDGLEATAHIRSLEDGSGYYESVPIVALTANAVSGVREMFLRNGMNDFLPKPIDMAKLHTLLEKWIPEEKKSKEARRTCPSGEIAPIHIEGIDVPAGIAMTGGTLDGYRKTLALYHTDGTDKINKIRDCLAKHEFKRYTAYVHAMKSAAASIGASEISELFKTLEMAGAREDTQFIHENTTCVLEKAEALLENIYAVVSTSQGERSENPELLRNELLRLREALHNRDGGEIDDIMNLLKTAAWPPQTGALFREIERNVFLIRYPDAAALVDKLLSFV